MKLLPLLLMAPLAAHALSFEAGVSSTNYGTQGDGTWYQQGMPHVLNTKTYGFSAGITGSLWARGAYGVDWHVDFVSLGHVSSTCDCTPIDSNYNTQTHSLVANPVPVANAQFVGNGQAQGVALTVEPWIRYRGRRFGIEAGLFPYRPSWDETIYNWQVQPGVSQTLHVSTPHGLQLGQVVGINVGQGNLTVGLKHYWLPTRFDSTHSPALWKGATVVEVKYKF
jgi:hypothetical protein